MSDIRYCWALSDSDPFQGECATREEAIKEALEDARDNPDFDGPTVTVWTGEADEIRPSDLLRGADVEWLLENLDEALSEEAGAERPVYLPERTDRFAMVAALEASIGEVLDRWTDEWGIPRQYRVEKVREHTVTLDPVEGDDE